MAEYLMDEHTVALLHFNGGITDESGKVWTAVNGAATSMEQSKFGGSSLHLNGTNQYLSTTNVTDFDFGSGDFTIEWWEYRTANSPHGCVFARQPGAYVPIMVGYNIGKVYAYATAGIGYNWNILSEFNLGYPILNTWTHYALVRADGYFYSFQNGKQISKSGLITTAIPAGTGTPLLGVYYSTETFPGYIDEFRISKIARWTSDFDPGEEPATPTPAPMNLTATAGDKKVILSWTAVTGAAGYNVKRSITAGGPYTAIASNVFGTSYEDTDVMNDTTYYYVVTAVGPNGESANSNEASATPQASSGQGLLRITLTDSSEREYQLAASEVDTFINWYRAVGSDKTCYLFSKRIGSQSSKEYLAYDKIISFEVKDILG